VSLKPDHSESGFLRRHRVLSGVLALVLALLGVWGVRLWQLRHQVDRDRDYWAAPKGEPGGILYVALGDSVAQGIGASGPERGYVGLLAERLRIATGRPVLVVNLSRSGASPPPNSPPWACHRRSGATVGGRLAP